jgi:hypothetical protein
MSTVQTKQENERDRPTSLDCGQVWYQPRWAKMPHCDVEWIIILHSRDMSTRDVSCWTDAELDREPFLRTPGEYWWGTTWHMFSDRLFGGQYNWLHEEKEVLKGFRGEWQYLGTLNEFLSRANRATPGPHPTDQPENS